MISIYEIVPLFTCPVFPRGNGLIINMSSEAGAQPQPMLSLYSATKVRGASYIRHYCCHIVFFTASEEPAVVPI